jgi:hypothetical protein
MSSETSRRLTTDTLMTIDAADLDAREHCCTAECRTRAMTDDFYQCQIHRSGCGYAVPFGTSCLCMPELRREYSTQRMQQEFRQLESVL